MFKKLTLKNIISLIIIIVLIVVILILLPRSCSRPTEPSPSSKPTIDDPVGDYSVTDEQQNSESSKTESSEVPSITFAGYGKYTVSADMPNLELKNPDVNFVDMVFTVTDAKSGEVIARTGKVAAGKFVYVNVMDFYKEKGVYNVEINISTYDSKSGAQMNGMNQKLELTVN